MAAHNLITRTGFGSCVRCVGEPRTTQARHAESGLTVARNPDKKQRGCREESILMCQAASTGTTLYMTGNRHRWRRDPEMFVLGSAALVPPCGSAVAVPCHSPRIFDSSRSQLPLCMTGLTSRWRHSRHTAAESCVHRLVPRSNIPIVHPD